jgi:hypothetical protein
MNGTVWTICPVLVIRSRACAGWPIESGTEVDVDTVDTDSIGDHTFALGLGWLLGFTIRPRIKRISMPNSYARVAMHPNSKRFCAIAIRAPLI